MFAFGLACNRLKFSSVHGVKEKKPRENQNPNPTFFHAEIKRKLCLFMCFEQLNWFDGVRARRRAPHQLNVE